MIETMSKVSVITATSRTRSVITRLGALGLLHIDASQVIEETTPKLRHRRDCCRQALLLLEELTPAHSRRKQHEHETSRSRGIEPGTEISTRIVERWSRLQELNEERVRLLKLQQTLQPWGDFSPSDVEALAERNIELRFYHLSRNQRMQFKTGTLLVVSRQSSQYYCVHVRLPGQPQPNLPLDIMEQRLPAQRLSEVEQRLQAIIGEQRAIRQQIIEQWPQLHQIDRAYRRLDDLCRLKSVGRAMERSGRLRILTGFAPHSSLPTMRQAARNHGWGLVIRKPAPDDPVPTKIRTIRPVTIVAPIFRLLGITPGYHEMDISFWFLIFFAMFAGMIIGDGGYGLLMIASSILLAIGGRKKPRRSGLRLLAVLGTTTLIWGAVTGNWFGYQPLAQQTILGRLTIASLNGFDPRSTPLIQWFCFILGTVHLSIAHIWRFGQELRRRPAIRALAQLGWLLVVWGLYSLVISLVLSGQSFFIIERFLPLIIAGLIIVVLFARQEGRFWKGVLQGLGGIFTTFLDSISTFSDIISYVRLFAVGLASLEIARSFNLIAGNIGTGFPLVIFSVVVLSIGHTLNLLLGGLSMLVHGVRLKMLEFSSHLGLEWNGIPYRPFTRGAIDSNKRRI